MELEDLERRGQGGGGDLWPQVARSRVEVVGDRGREELLQLGDPGALVAAERLVGRDELGEVVVELRLLVRGGEDEVAQGAEGVLARWPFSECLGERVADPLEIAEEHVLLAREVGEERPGGDTGRLGDLGQRRLLVASAGEELQGGSRDRLARLLLLPLAMPGVRGAHGRSLALLSA